MPLLQYDRYIGQSFMGEQPGAEEHNRKKSLDYDEIS